MCAPAIGDYCGVNTTAMGFELSGTLPVTTICPLSLMPLVLVPHLVRLAGRRLPAAPLFAHAATRKRAQDWAREQVTRICKLACHG